MHEYRIVYRPEFEADPCVWQLQARARVFWLFSKWVRVSNFSSATSAANEMLALMSNKTPS